MSMIKKNLVIALTLVCTLVGATCFANPTPSKQDIEALKAKIEMQESKCGPQAIFEYFSDEDYANGRVPSDISDIVIEPDDSCN